MDSIYSALKNFLLSKVNASLSEETGIQLAAFDEKHIVFGLVDITKFSGAKVIASILPERQTLGTGNAADVVMDNEILLTVICGGDTFENVQKKAFLYAKRIETEVFEKNDWTGEIEDVRFESAEYTFDAGPVPGQMSAVEIRLTVSTEIETDDPFSS